MTGPMPSSALRGLKVNGAYGNVFSDIGKSISGLVTESKADQAAKQEQAMKQALQSLNEQKFGYEQKKDATDFGLRRDELTSKDADRKADNEQRLAQMHITDANADATRAQTAEDRAARLAQQKATSENNALYHQGMLGLGKERNDLSRQRILMQNERGTLVQDEFGKFLMFKPNSHTAEEMELGPDGTFRPKSEQGGAATKGVTPDGAPEAPSGIQPGATTDPTVEHGGLESKGSPAKPMRGSGAKATDAQLQMNMLITSIEPSIARVQSITKAPNFVEQGLADAAKKGGLVGGAANTVLGGDKSTMLGSAGNALGLSAPEYQTQLTDMTKIYRAYVYVTTGKALNQAEAEDAARQYVIQAGMPPELVEKVKRDISVMADAVRGQAGKARDWVDRYNAQGGEQGAAEAEPTTASAYWSYLRSQGMSADEAKAQTLQKFPNAKMKGQ